MATKVITLNKLSKIQVVLTRPDPAQDVIATASYVITDAFDAFGQNKNFVPNPSAQIQAQLNALFTMLTTQIVNLEGTTILGVG